MSARTQELSVLKPSEDPQVIELLTRRETDPRLIQLLAQRSPRLLYREISSILGIPPGSVARAAQELIQQKLIPGRHHQKGARQPTRAQMMRLQHIARRRAESYTWQQIAKEEGTTRQAVQQITTKYPLHYWQCLLRTELAPNAADLARLRRIAKRYNQGWEWSRIGKDDGTDAETVQALTRTYRQHFAYCLARVRRQIPEMIDA
jgi:hypothetical protein